MEDPESNKEIEVDSKSAVFKRCLELLGQSNDKETNTGMGCGIINGWAGE